MENTLAALADALSSMKKTQRSIGANGEYGGTNEEFEQEKLASAVSQNRIAELKAQKLKEEMHELREYFSEVSLFKTKVDDKVLSLDNYGAVQGVSSAKRFADESNQRARAMVGTS